MDNSTTTELTPHQRSLILATVALALMMVVSAVSGLNVALPEMSVAIGASQTQVTWIVDAYTLVFAGLLLPAGALGDRYGRKGVLLAGTAVFGTAALAASFATNPSVLIGLRAIMGVGASAVMPVTLSVITTSFPPAERGRAVGVWVGVAGGGAVLGLFGSGALLEVFAWNSFFALNVVLAALAGLGTVLFVPASRDEHPPRLDAAGAALSLLAVAGLVFGTIEGPERGWGDALPIGAFVLGSASLVAFVLWELKTAEPMLDPRLFRLRGFSGGTLAVTCQFFASFGLFYVVLQYLQYIQGQSPLRSAVSLLPLPLVLIPLARNAPRIAARFGTNRVVPLGLLLSAAGMLTMTTLEVDMQYWRLALALVLFGAGMGLAGTPSTTAITASLPPSKQGVGSAVNDTARELGSALGIAVLGSLLTSGYRDGVRPATAGLPATVADKAESSIAFIKAGALQLQNLGGRGKELAHSASQAFVDATGTAFGVAAGVLLVAAMVVAWRAPGAEPAPSRSAEDQPRFVAGQPETAA